MVMLSPSLLTSMA